MYDRRTMRCHTSKIFMNGVYGVRMVSVSLGVKFRRIRPEPCKWLGGRDTLLLLVCRLLPLEMGEGEGERALTTLSHVKVEMRMEREWRQVLALLRQVES